MKRIILHLPRAYIAALERLVKIGRYPHRAEAIRMAVRDLLHREGVFPNPQLPENPLLWDLVK